MPEFLDVFNANGDNFGLFRLLVVVLTLNYNVLDELNHSAESALVRVLTSKD
jgi:hypothetical protein